MNKCPNCDSEYERIAQHFALSSCGYPDLDEQLTDLLVGLLIGDGFVQKTSANANLLIRMTNKEYLEWVDKVTPEWITTNSGVYMDRTAEESFELTKQSNRGATSIDNHRKYWRLQFTKHEFFTGMRDIWYEGSTKTGPDNISLTPVQAKHWFVSDGGIHIRKNGDGRPQSNIYADGLIDSGWDESVFSECPVTPKMMYGNKFAFTADQTEVFLNWIGEPVPGFEYKWETDREEYMKKKNSVYNQKI